MSWMLLVGVGVVLGIAMLLAALRRVELDRMQRAVASREQARRRGSDEARLQYPLVDLSRCLGCATCVAVCPETGVLDIVHGQAVVVNGARCEGISACERECPTGAITVTIANLETRTDVPVLSDELEAWGSPGLFLAGEVTAHALIKRAVDHGTAVAAGVAERVRAGGGRTDALDLVIVGAGPAGLACALEAKRQGLRFLVVDQEVQPGGTVAKYPRRKLVMTSPLVLPIYGRFSQTTYLKEELVALWQRIVFEQGLDFRGNEVFAGLRRDPDGRFSVETSVTTHRASHVCLAIGRRGVPRRLEVPGEALPKVAYGLLDAASYRGRRILVVGGGNSAVEAALALSEQPETAVTLSYRRPAFFRLKERNAQRVEQAISEGRIEARFGSRVRDIRPDAVELQVVEGESVRTETLPNDDVFVLAGGVPPFELLQSAGVSFDPSLRPAPEPPAERRGGAVRGLLFAFLLTLLAGGFYALNRDYYLLPGAERVTHENHDWLRPGRGLGLWLGIAGTALIAINLLYLWRRSPRTRMRLGSLSAWMTSHIATGVLAFLCIALHGALSPRSTPGGHAFWALLALLVTGAIGRYLYAWVPRAANGRELELDELKARFGADLEARPGRRSFLERARTEVLGLIEDKRWRGSFLGRVGALFGVHRELSRTLRDIEKRGREAGVPPEEVAETVRYARHTHRRALLVAHLEDMRALLSSWRFLHRWLALLMVLLAAIHIAYALNFGTLREAFGPSVEPQPASERPAAGAAPTGRP